MSTQSSSPTSAVSRSSGKVRLLFAIGVLPAFYAADDDTAEAVKSAIAEAYSNLGERFGVVVLGTFDDLDLHVGASSIVAVRPQLLRARE